MFRKSLLNFLNFVVLLQLCQSFNIDETTTVEMSADFEVPASSESNTTPAAPADLSQLYQNKRRFLVSTIVIVLGVIGNFLALVILARKKATKHSKYTFMLR